MFNKWLILHFTLNAPLPSGSTEYTPLFVTPDFRTSAQFTSSEIQWNYFTTIQQYRRIFLNNRILRGFQNVSFKIAFVFDVSSVLIGVLRFYLYIFLISFELDIANCRNLRLIETWGCLSYQPIFNNYSPKAKWKLMNIYGETKSK
jgi:hypothetical protein